MHSFPAFILALAALPAGAMAQLDIAWSTLDGGGGTSTGGPYSLSGTIGQPDAGVMSGGSFTLSGGFWAFQPSASQCNPDVNQDGVADQGDVDYLINVIAGGPNDTGIDPDFNRDGVPDQGDVDAMINVIAGGPCP